MKESTERVLVYALPYARDKGLTILEAVKQVKMAIKEAEKK